MIKDTVVNVANDLLNQKANMTSWMELVSDYCTKNDKSGKGISLFPNLPQNIQVQIIKGLIDYYCKEYNISSVGQIDSLAGTVIINGVVQSNYKPFYYFYKL